MSSAYDYVIAGSGAAGLSLAVHLLSSGKFNDKRILLADRDEKRSNDRTWCFWEKEPGLFESIVHRKWEKAWFHGQTTSRLLTLAPYSYKLIRGLDYYKYCFRVLEKFNNIEFVKGEISDLRSENGKAFCRVEGKEIQSGYVFSSLYQKPGLQKRDHFLLQHFLGWRIKTSTPVFDPSVAVLMDFRVPQSREATFIYILPFNDSEALVEYTVFSASVLERDRYEKGIAEYLREHYPGIEYSIEETEFGVIPMTDHDFGTGDERIIPIGTAGGQTKASTGYTFSFIQKHSREIVKDLLTSGRPLAYRPGNARSRFYDRTFLEVLQNGSLPGHKVFERLFTRNSPQRIFKFLDNETGLGEEIGLLLSLPAAPFLKAALRS